MIPKLSCLKQHDSVGWQFSWNHQLHSSSALSWDPSYTLVSCCFWDSWKLSFWGVVHYHLGWWGQLSNVSLIFWWRQESKRAEAHRAVWSLSLDLAQYSSSTFVIKASHKSNPGSRGRRTNTTFWWVVASLWKGFWIQGGMENWGLLFFKISVLHWGFM